MSEPTARDWVSTFIEDLIELDIALELGEILSMKRQKLKILVKDAIRKKAFSYLLERKEGRISDNAKGKEISYQDLLQNIWIAKKKTFLWKKENGCFNAGSMIWTSKEQKVEI